MISNVLELERLTIVAPLGLRFWDSLSAQTVSDGLLVSVYPNGEPRRAVPALPTRSGVFVVRHIPGLRTIESGAGDADFWAGLSTRLDLVVEVACVDGRFVSFSLHTSAPQRGLMAWPDMSSPLGSPFGTTLSVPLFSAATRPVPGGVGVIRAQLVDPTQNGGRGGPAAWAVLEVLVPGQPPTRSIADAQGRVALLFPYPAPVVESLAAANGSPLSPLSPLPGPTASALTDKTWTVEVGAAYRALDPVPRVPDLSATLEQPSAVIWADLARTRILIEAPLRFGRETVLRSSDDSGREPSSVLLVQSASPL